MSINNLPEEVVKHEIMTYLKPKYKVVEVTYLAIETHQDFDFENNEPKLRTRYNVRTGLFKISNLNPEISDFNPYNCYMTKTTFARIEKIKEEISTHQDFDKVFHTGRENDYHATYIYISHSMVCS